MGFEPVTVVKVGGQIGNVTNYRNTDALDGVPRVRRNNLMCPRCVPDPQAKEKNRLSTIMKNVRKFAYSMTVKGRGLLKAKQGTRGNEL